MVVTSNHDYGYLLVNGSDASNSKETIIVRIRHHQLSLCNYVMKWIVTSRYRLLFTMHLKQVKGSIFGTSLLNNYLVNELIV